MFKYDREAHLGAGALLQPLETLTPEAVASLCPPALEQAAVLAEQSKLVQTPAGKLCLTYVLAATTVLRRLVNHPDITTSPLYQSAGGESYNPHLTIDAIGGGLIDVLVPLQSQTINLYVEERNNWQRSPATGADWSVVVDPLDETNAMSDHLRVQSTAITVADRDGRLLAGGVGSLVDPWILLTEGEQHQLVFYKEVNAQHAKADLWGFPLALPEPRKDQQLRLATLPRRVAQLRQSGLLAPNEDPKLMTFGGYGLLALLKGEIDAMLDPGKGQLWYEAYLWGQMAQEVGLPVSTPDGNPLDFAAILARSQAGVTPRVPLIISAKAEVHRQLIAKLQENKGLIYPAPAA